MKWSFAMIKFFEVIFVLWCCVVTNAQNSGNQPLVKNATSFVRSNTTAVAGTMNASKTSPSFKMTLVKSQTSVPHLHSSVKGTRTIINSTMTVIPTTVHSTTGPMKDGGSKLALIIGCVTAAVVVVIVVALVVVLYKCRRRKMYLHHLKSNWGPTARGDFRKSRSISDPSKPIRSASPAQIRRILGDSSRHIPIMKSIAATTFPDSDRRPYTGISEFEGYEGDFRKSRSISDPSKRIKSASPAQIRRILGDSSRHIPIMKSIAATTFPDSDRRPYTGISEFEGYEETRLHRPRPGSVERISRSIPKYRRSKSAFKYPGFVKKIITADGGVIDIDDIILKIGPGCLAKDTEIIFRNIDADIAIKSLLDLGLIDAAPRVVEFHPDGLKFLKPADLTIRFKTTFSNSELFILHGSYNHIYQKIVWELVTNGIEESNVKGVVNGKINGFCFYMFILATRGMLARILSHLNHSFTCRAYALYRRLSTMDTIDISVVLLSEFVDDDKGENIKQLKDHLEAGYVKGDKGMLKRVHTDRRLEMSLDFPGVENPPFSFDVDQPELDSVGFVIDHFKEIAVKSPASGKVKISEVDRDAENESLWRMNICEMEEKIKVEVAEVQFTAPEPQPEVVYRTTKLTNGEITRMSRMVGVDWDCLAGLLDIPYSEREEIRVDYKKYPTFWSKAKQIFELFNNSKFFDRHILVKYFKELGRHDLKKELLPMEDENGSEEVETPPSLPETTEEDLLDTTLSPREMSRLSRRIVVEWDRLAGLMDITSAERDDIRYSLIFNDNRSRAEKILAIFNRREGFSRETLANCLEEIQQLDLIKPVTTGEWRNV